MNKFRQALIASTFLVAALGRADAQDFGQFVAFGDSNVDSGFYRALPNPGGGATFNALWPAAVAAGAGTPTSRPGLMSSEELARLFGLTAIPSNQPGGTNYATSGAKNIDVNSAVNGGFQQAIPTVTQIANFLAANGGRVDGNTLFYINSGANDVSFAVGNGGTGSPPADPTAYLVNAANGLADAVAQLKAAGGRYFVVPNLPYSFPTGAGNADVRQARLEYSTTLWSALAANGVNFIPADWNAVRLAIVANPASFGFQFIGTGAGQVACTRPAGVGDAFALLCSSNPAAPSTFVSPDADRTRLFADEEGHMTTAGMKVQADYFYSLIVAPSQISFLAEVPVKTRAALVSAIMNQISISQHQLPANGTNVWITGDVSHLKMDSYPGFPGDPGTPAAVTAGVDMRLSPRWLVGGAVSVGLTKQSYSTAGHFIQNEFAVSLYAAYRDGRTWGNIVGSAGAIRDDVNRTVPIGITLQPNTGTTDGSNLSLALLGGYDIGTGTFTHGPMAGIVLQRIRINGFTESGSFTSLGFEDQTRNSAVSQLGYQIVMDAGRFRPFVRAAWHHELADTDRSVTAFLTTVAAPTFSMPAVVFGKDWIAGSAGTTMRMSNSMTGYIAAYGQAAQRNVTNYGVQFGLNVSLAPNVASNLPVKASPSLVR